MEKETKMKVYCKDCTKERLFTFCAYTPANEYTSVRELEYREKYNLKGDCTQFSPTLWFMFRKRIMWLLMLGLGG